MRVHHVLHGTIEMMARVHVCNIARYIYFIILHYVAQHELSLDYVT